MRVLVEVVHIVAGLAAAVLIASAAAWSYPLARSDIWLVAFVAMALVVLMGLGPLRRAFAIDRARLRRKSKDIPNG
jgi:type IV secretory pathway TrbD component